MTLDDTKKAYEDLTGKASDIVRQLSLGGIALIWLFRLGTDKAFTLEISLLRAALFIFLALTFDFLQYLVSASIWFWFFRKKEKECIQPDVQFEAPVYLPWPGWVLFFLKSAMLLIAYAGFIVPFLLRKFAG